MAVGSRIPRSFGLLLLALAAVSIAASAVAGCPDFASAPAYAVGRSPVAVVIGDFNRDGKSDLAVANNSAFTISILFGKGDGKFTAGGIYDAGMSPQSIAAGDVNGDGKLDLATANSFSNDVSVLLGSG